MNMFFAVALLSITHSSAQEPPSVQIGRPITVRASTAPLTGPLATPINLNLPDGTLGSFFEEVGRQSKTEYILVQGLEKCRIAAFVRNLTLRQLLQTTLEAGGMSYQQLGRSNSYTIVRRRGGPTCQPPPRPAPSGLCTSGSKPIPLECTNAPLTALAKGIFEQADASIIVWNDAVEYPASIKLSKTSLTKALMELRKIPGISVRQIGKDAKFLISMTNPAVEREEFTQTPSSAAVRYGTRRDEPPANPAFPSIPAPVGVDDESHNGSRQTGSHATVGELFNAKPEDIRITIEKWADFASLRQRTDFGGKEVEILRNDLRDYIEVSDAERKAVAVSFVGMGERAGTMVFPDGIRAEWKQLHFLTLRISMAGAKSKTLVFMPRAWLESIRWK